MNIAIDSFKQGKKPGTWLFNIGIDSDNLQILLNGFRVVNKKIYAPAYMYAFKKYKTIIYLDENMAKKIYEKVKEKLGKDLGDFEEAAKSLIITEAEIKKTLPNMEIE